MSDFRVPGRGVIAAGLLIYVLFGLLFPAWIFRRLRRAEWTFPAMVAAAGAAVFAIHHLGGLAALESAEIEELTIVRAHGDGNAGEATSFLGLISPRRSALALAPIAPEDEAVLASGLPQPLRVSREAMGDFVTSPLVLESGAAGRLRLAPQTLPPHAMRYLRYDYRLSIDRLASISVEEASQRVKIDMKNRSSGPCSLYLVRRDSWCHVARLAAGEAASLEASLAQGPEWLSMPASLSGDGMSRELKEALQAPLQVLLDRPTALPAAPHALILFEAPAFPEVKSFHRRHALTILLLPIPSRSAEE